MPRPIHFDGALFTYTDTDPPELVGYLFAFENKGIFSPDGKVDATPEQLTTHNTNLTKAMIDGLDTQCAVGQGGTFYVLKKHGDVQAVTAWTGEIVSTDFNVQRTMITFRRKGKTFKGYLPSEGAAFNFRRIS